ncbi:MAG: 6-bladed beta-propeller [Dehalococcoidales bacterium]|nr:6-bladed beta-propeller [Dehalococcoidales bacterium]
MVYGEGKYTYELADWHAEYPGGWQPVEVNGLAVDSQDRLYAFNTGEYPVTVFDSNGKLVKNWGGDTYGHSHGAYIGPDDSLYYADDGNHTVNKMTTDGKILMTLGTKGKPSDTGYMTVDASGKKLNVFEAIATTKRGGPPFNAPTDIALSPSGEIYVSDGYGNARVHTFTADGKLLFSWGEPGHGPSQFVVPHAVAVDKQGRVFIADRHNNRLQIFDEKGKYLEEWTSDLKFPTDIFIDKDQTVYVSELMRPGISIFDINGKLLARWGNEGRTKEDPLFVTLHAIVVDSQGSIYVAEVMGMQAGTPFLATRKTRMIQKFTRKA